MAMTALLIGVAILAYPAYLGAKAYRLPAIYDITTDPIDPPRFEAIARLRPRDANPIVYAGLRAAELQKAAYPKIEPLIVSVTPQIAYEAAVAVMTKRKWRIVDARAPQAGRRDGRIEAVARARRSSVSATTWWCASAPIRTARASISARPRATAGTISAPMRRA